MAGRGWVVVCQDRMDLDGPRGCSVGSRSICICICICAGEITESLGVYSSLYFLLSRFGACFNTHGFSPALLDSGPPSACTIRVSPTVCLVCLSKLWVASCTVPTCIYLSYFHGYTSCIHNSCLRERLSSLLVTLTQATVVLA